MNKKNHKMFNEVAGADHSSMVNPYEDLSDEKLLDLVKKTDFSPLREVLIRLMKDKIILDDVTYLD